MENVPQVICPDFTKWQLKLESLGYKNYVEILNAKDYGIPQNRSRCFMVSILGDYVYKFPMRMRLKHKLKDFLEKEVDEKYYLDDKTIQRISSWGGYEKPLENMIQVDYEQEKVLGTITTHVGKDSNGMKLVAVKGEDKNEE